MPSLGLQYVGYHEEKVKSAIYKGEGKRLERECSFYNVVYFNPCGPLEQEQYSSSLLGAFIESEVQHFKFVALSGKFVGNMEYHSYVISRYYSDEWLHGDPKQVPPHVHEEVTEMKNE